MLICFVFYYSFHEFFSTLQKYNYRGKNRFDEIDEYEEEDDDENDEWYELEIDWQQFELIQQYEEAGDLATDTETPM